MESECPHLAASLEQAEIEDIADDKVLVCPWHQFDFSLKTGLSTTSGLQACTFKVVVKDDSVFVEPPGNPGDDWRLISIRPVSEKFPEGSTSTQDPVRDLSAPLPTNLYSFCRLILLTPVPSQKVSLTRTLLSLFRSGSLKTISTPSALLEPLPLIPPRTPNIKIVDPSNVGKRGKGGTAESRAKLLHALAWVELWAIDLSIDICARFCEWRVGSMDGKEGKTLGLPFFADFLKVAEDEAKHFSILRQRIEELGWNFGDWPVHNGLWESAIETQDSLFSRIAIVHLVHEARGLDVNPMQIKRCRTAGDHESADVMTIIHNDETTHVSTGHRHFQYLCKNNVPPLDPIETFRKEVKEHFYGKLKGPFNVEDREKAGLTGEWYDDLVGGMGRAERAERDNVEVKLEALQL